MRTLLLLLAACTSQQAPPPPPPSPALHLHDRVPQGRWQGPEPPAPPAPLRLVATDGSWTCEPACPGSEAGLVLAGEQVARHPLPDLSARDWSAVEVELAVTGALRDLHLAVGDQRLSSAVVTDGRVRTTRLHLDGTRSAPLGELSLSLSGPGEGNGTLQALTLVPRGQAYAAAPAGHVRARYGKAELASLYLHAPGSLELDLDLPAEARLDLALGLGEDEDPVGVSVAVRTADGEEHLLLDQDWSEPEAWASRHLDLSPWSGRAVTLRLGASSPVPGAVALLGHPVVHGRPAPDRPNVIVYAIDGGGADYMSVYGYDRPTTPFLEELAAEGVRFEWAHTTSGWTKSSTASFLTSLHHSVLGGYRTDADQVPAGVVTMAERFHAAGYQTAVFTSNPFAGSMSGLQRGVDLFRDQHAEVNSASSAELHQDFLAWREAWPAEPYWVHFQTTDVHEPHAPVAPVAGTWIDSARRAAFEGWWKQVHAAGGPDRDTVLGRYLERLDRLGIDRHAFFAAQRDLYDETMLHNDQQLRALVAELKRRGEWERTLLVITADHGHPAGSFSRFGRGLLEPQPADWEGALADSYRSRVPLLVVWPGHLPAGRVVKERVSLIDLLPTVLDLAELPPAEVAQGQSWRPLLTDEGTWTPRPVVLDQFQGEPETGLLVGHIEVIDGRWAASMEVVPPELEARYQATDSLRTAGGWRAARPHRPGTPRVLLYDYEADPLCTTSVNDRYPEELARLTALLEQHWSAHQALAARFSPEGEATVTAEQLEALRVLGYVE